MRPGSSFQRPLLSASTADPRRRTTDRIAPPPRLLVCLSPRPLLSARGGVAPRGRAHGDNRTTMRSARPATGGGTATCMPARPSRCGSRARSAVGVGVASYPSTGTAAPPCQRDAHEDSNEIARRRIDACIVLLCCRRNSSQRLIPRGYDTPPSCTEPGRDDAGNAVRTHEIINYFLRVEWFSLLCDHRCTHERTTQKSESRSFL